MLGQFDNLNKKSYTDLVLEVSRGRAVWQLVWLITRRSQVQILPPQQKVKEAFLWEGLLFF